LLPSSPVRQKEHLFDKADKRGDPATDVMAKPLAAKNEWAGPMSMTATVIDLADYRRRRDERTRFREGSGESALVGYPPIVFVPMWFLLPVMMFATPASAHGA
jgi:hypothetical protein